MTAFTVPPALESFTVGLQGGESTPFLSLLLEIILLRYIQFLPLDIICHVFIL